MEEAAGRILVVDDEPGMREGCRKVLVASGYEVETAPDGVAGLELLQKGGRFAAALIDLKMPRMGGIELIEEIRKLDPDIVLFVITAYATVATAVEATKKGAYGYIPKPFTPDELMLAVSNGLEKRALSLEARRLREERERRLLEVAFERSKSHTIINCMTDGVVVVNRDGQLVLRNAAAARMIPRLAAVSLPLALPDALQEPDLDALLTETLGSTAGATILSRELLIEDRACIASASPVTEPTGEVLGAVAVLRDITALRRLETAKSMFVSMVAHEIKSPLGAIEGLLHVVLGSAKSQYSERDREMLRRALVRSAALRELLSDLLTVTSMETGNFNISRSPLDVGAVVGTVVDARRGEAQEKDLELLLELPDAHPAKPVLADENAMTSIVGNLLDNAIKYTPRGGRVAVGVQYSPDYAVITVQDSGIGMSEEEKERAFDEFYRAKNRLAIDVAGTGLGLTIVKRLVDMHNGMIDVESEPGRGTTLRVSIPLATDCMGTPLRSRS